MAKKVKKQQTTELDALHERRATLGESWASACSYESVQNRRNGLESASWEPGVPIVPDVLNQYPLLLNVKNGTLDLERCELREHRREELLTQIAPVAFDPDASCPKFEAFLNEAVPDAAVRLFLQRAFGYSITGLVREHKLFFLHGLGNNGKSTLLRALCAPLGGDYAGPASPKLLIKRAFDEHLTEIAQLFGRRLAVVSESGEQSGLDEEKVKYLTGGDRLMARRMREDMWSFAPTHKFWFQSNHLPKVEGTDEGIWRRILHVPFTVAPKVLDLDLPEKLEKEAAGILRWGIEGLRSYLDVGLAPPEQVLVATKHYRDDQDLVGRFIDECLVLDPDGRVSATEVFRRFSSWCRDGGEPPMSNTAFGTRFERPGVRKVKSSGIHYLGVRFGS